MGSRGTVQKFSWDIWRNLLVSLKEVTSKSAKVCNINILQNHSLNPNLNKNLFIHHRYRTLSLNFEVITVI